MVLNYLSFHHLIAVSEEADIGFHEHVFLDHLIEEGFPKKGPVRQFMELVSVVVTVPT